MSVQKRVAVLLVGVLAVSPWNAAARAADDVPREEPPAPQEEVRVFRLQETTPSIVKVPLDSLFEGHALRLAVHEPSNQLVAVGSPQTLDQIAEIIESLDREPTSRTATPQYRVDVTVWQVDDESGRLDALVKEKAGGRLPLNLPRDECQELVASLAEAGLVSQPARLQCGLLAEQEVQMNAGSRCPVEQSRAVSREGVVTKNFTYESVGAAVRLRVRRVTGGAVAELFVEDSRISPTDTGSSPDEDAESVPRYVVPPTVTMCTLQTSLWLPDGEASLYSTGGGPDGLRLLYVVDVTRE
ncbi:hypothetical protein Pla123a_34270 [Posidoniimonas polymericola]|uniref:NolW-like domain-containing protein n=1 Tax=Posidoniimonas polymericola TaxID=2528002 RepID=A0A5C5YIB0_9BACT|nr:secretin N-terminal domain-containing protein [Posidoniimonas polymericola]TWT74603.1 hypothetical protein Pla123a_34270 [Posidoniimonas polymericola]